jgi:hypothetical protein
MHGTNARDCFFRLGFWPLLLGPARPRVESSRRRLAEADDDDDDSSKCVGLLPVHAPPSPIHASLTPLVSRSHTTGAFGSSSIAAGARWWSRRWLCDWGRRGHLGRSRSLALDTDPSGRCLNRGVEGSWRRLLGGPRAQAARAGGAFAHSF